MLVGDFAVILLDVQMPGMDGIETAELIKARERSRDVPIIFLTAAESDLAEVFAGYEAGAVDYLLKPFDPLVLRSKVKVFADLDRHRRQLRRSDELVRNAFAAAPSGMALCDLDGLALQVNPALERLTGRATRAAGARADPRRAARARPARAGRAARRGGDARRRRRAVVGARRRR